MGVAFADYDNDDRPDLLVTNLALEKWALYHNDGKGTSLTRTWQQAWPHSYPETRVGASVCTTLTTMAGKICLPPKATF
ncbi:MAG: VCBS repeat-containing protein [Bryobacteraceae bacterium]